MAARLALQMDLPEETIRARVIEAHGYMNRPPKNGTKIMLMQNRFDKLDKEAIQAIRTVLPEFVSREEVERIREAYADSAAGNIHFVSWQVQIHPYIVAAVICNLREKQMVPQKGVICFDVLALLSWILSLAGPVY